MVPFRLLSVELELVRVELELVRVELELVRVELESKLAITSDRVNENKERTKNKLIEKRVK